MAAVAVALAGVPGAAQAQARFAASAHRQTGEAASHAVVDTGEVTASVVRLAGAPDWGAWYADVPLAENLRVNGVTLYDRAGREVASLTPSRP